MAQWCERSLPINVYSAPRGLSPGTPVFPSPQKPTFPNSNSILECVGINFKRVHVNSWCSVGKLITFTLHFRSLKLRKIVISKITY